MKLLLRGKLIVKPAVCIDPSRIHTLLWKLMTRKIVSCDFHKGEHCCSSLVCHTSRTSSISECRPPSDVKSEDEETLNVLRKPYLSLEQNLNSNSNTDESLEPKEEKKEEESKWDFLEAIKMPPRLDDITELPRCKPMNSKLLPLPPLGKPLD